MYLSTQAGVLADRIGIENALVLLKNAGFDAYDFSLFRMRHVADDPFNRDDYLDYAGNLRAFADSVGIVCNQAHAPFPSSKKDPAKTEKFFSEIVRAIEVAGILGAKAIVVHPQHHLKYRFHAKKLKEMNLSFYRKLIPYAEKAHVKIAVENMWQERHFPKWKIVDSTCSSPEEFCEYIDMLDSKQICACLDIGHIPITGHDPAAFIRQLGSKRLQALHIHDNDLIRDLHALPYQREINFEPILAALKEIGYQGDFTYEDETTLRKIPEALLPKAAKYMATVGRYMMAQIMDPK